jgi:large subunit ribosomal protein L1
LLARQFNTTSVLFARKERKIPVPTKKQLAAKARKKALKVRKHPSDSEKMPLQDAVAVLQVGTNDFWTLRRPALTYPKGG